MKDTKTMTMTGKIDLNSARVEEIAQLAGIDRAVAKKLTDHRDSHGGLMGWDDVAVVLADAKVVERLQRCFIIERMDRPEAAI